MTTPTDGDAVGHDRSGRAVRRRPVLAAALTALPLGAAVSGCAAGQTGRQAASELRLPPAFGRPLAVPPVLRPVRDRPGEPVLYRVVARATDTELVPGVRTPVFGYDGLVPGPTLEARRGRPVVVEHINELGVPMVVHLHGGVTPAVSDGFPTDLVVPRGGSGPRPAPGHAGGPDGDGDARGHTAAVDPRAAIAEGSRAYSYPMEQPAATLWYHDHRMDLTAPMVWRGLAGFCLLRDEVEDSLGLPAGDRELPLMVMDRTLDAEGRLAYPAAADLTGHGPADLGGYVAGVLGDVMLVNGVPWPVAEVDAARYRLRLLNASNARRYRLRFDPPPPDDRDPFVQIGADQGLLERPRAHRTLTFAPGERLDVVVDFAAWPVGSTVVLRNALGRGRLAEVMRFDVVRRARDGSRVPDLLGRQGGITAPAAATRRTFHFRRDGDSGWTINGQRFDPAAPLVTVPGGTTEVWRFGGDLHHPVHTHLAHFTVIGRGGSDPGPMDAGVKDTVDVRSAEFVDVAVSFPRLPGRYLLHCHALEHEDTGMMARFDVV